MMKLVRADAWYYDERGRFTYLHIQGPEERHKLTALLLPDLHRGTLSVGRPEEDPKTPAIEPEPQNSAQRSEQERQS